MLRLYCRKRGQQGSKIIELLIVNAIFCSIAAIALPSLISGLATIRGIEIMSDMRSVDNAIYIYMAQHDGVIPSFSQLKIGPVALLDTEPHPPRELAIFPDGSTYNGGGDYDITSGRCTLSDGRVVEDLAQ